MNAEIGQILASLRESSKLTQRQVAERMSANQTRVSRIEAGDGNVVDIDDYLAAIGTPDATTLAERLALKWVHLLPQPSLSHPDFETLAAVERGLSQVREFLDDGQVSTMLAGQAQLLNRRLEEAGRYLLSLDHEVVYVGDIGVGKTTAACRQAGLVIDAAIASDLKGMLLDTSGGRTTLCEVRVETGECFTLTVEPVPDDEIYKLVGEVCKNVFEKQYPEARSPGNIEFKPPEEVERALRNMAGLPRPRARRGATPAPDPAAELAKEYNSPEAFTEEFAERLSLWRRRRRTIKFEGSDTKAGRQWLRSTFTDINNGRHGDFSLPDRITVTVPFPLVSDARFSITVIDTRGIDGSAVRPDILRHLKNPRALTLLCSKWGSAPDQSALALLTHINETDADPTLFNHVVIIALARLGEALSMRHDSGEAAEDVAEGYEIKLGQIEDALRRKGLTEIKSFVFDASGDDPYKLTTFVLERIRAVRSVQTDAAMATIKAISQMIENRAQAEVMAALTTVSDHLTRFADRKGDLHNANRHPYERLLTAITSPDLHARTVWATTRRNGRFWNFDVFQYLGDGAAAEAKARSSKVVTELMAIIESDLDDSTLESAHSFLTQLRANVAQWEADFVNAARHHGATIYQQRLSRAQRLWDACERDYGSGRGQYCAGVASQLRTWFEDENEDENNAELREELERWVVRAWDTRFIAPLKRAAGMVPEGASNNTALG